MIYTFVDLPFVEKLVRMKLLKENGIAFSMTRKSKNFFEKHFPDLGHVYMFDRRVLEDLKGEKQEFSDKEMSKNFPFVIAVVGIRIIQLQKYFLKEYLVSLLKQENLLTDYKELTL